MHSKSSSKFPALPGAIWLAAILAITFFCTCQIALAQEASTTDAMTPVARVVEVEGEAWYRPTGANAEEIAVSRDLVISAGGTVITGKRGKVALLLADESLVRLHYNSEFTLRAAAPTAGWLQRTSRQLKSSYELLRGELWFRNKRREADIDIDTAHVSISVRGTEFSVEAGEEVVLVNMLEGAIQAANGFGQVDAASGEQVIAERGKAPRKRLILNPDDAVQWTIKLPPLFDAQSFAALCLQWSTGKAREQLGQATAMAVEGDYLEAAAMLEDVVANNSGANDVAIATYRNWLLLESGDGAAAAQANSELVQDNPEFVPALYLDTLLALMQNYTRRAMVASGRALAIDANDANAQLLRSYALQSAFKLAAAKDAAERAIALDAGLVVARLQSARLAIGAGDFDTAISILDDAAAVNNSNDLDVLTMRGFALLARGDAGGASINFEAALQTGFSSADLSVGRGLLAMRSGNRERALEFFAEAVAIEPLDASYMNYFGRVLYEMRRFDRAMEVLQRASQLDPNDPTPYYLMAIIQRDLNRDGEAIALLQEAEIRNDKRAVYRPRYVLDQDLAIKNVDQSLAFQAFRLNAWAKRKAVDALSRDRNNYSAHLLYAGAVNEEPGRDTIFASEALKARLLQPANANTFNTFANYTSVFDVPTFGGVASASTGSFDITELDLTLYGAVPKANLALQGAISRARSDGWRGTEDELFRSTALLAKWDAAPRHSFLATFNRIELEQSDNELQRFEFDAPSEPRNERATELASYELGYHYKPEPQIDLISYITLLEQDIDRFSRIVFPPQSLPPFGLLEQSLLEDIFIKQKIVVTQNQITLGHNTGSLRAGIFTYNNDQYLDELRIVDEVTLGGVPQPAFSGAVVSDSFTTSKPNQISIYFSGTYSPTSKLSVEAALYRDRYTNANIFSGVKWQMSKLNPRLGIVFKPFQRHTFRLASYRYLFSLVRGRIDAVDIAGLDIYRGSSPGSLTTDHRLAYEYDWPTGFLQIEGFVSDVRDEQRSRDATNVLLRSIINTERDGAGITLNQLFARSLGLATKYEYLDIADNQQNINNRREEQARAALTWINSSGITLGAEALYRNLRFVNRPDDDDYVLLNAFMEFEFPRNLGKLSLQGNNLSDENINWVTDAFVIDGRIPERNWRATLELYF